MSGEAARDKKEGVGPLATRKAMRGEEQLRVALTSTGRREEQA